LLCALAKGAAAAVEEAFILWTTEGQEQEQDRTGQDRTGQDRTGQDRTGQDRTGQDRQKGKTGNWNAAQKIKEPAS
jgi:hypothetical protein